MNALLNGEIDMLEAVSTDHLPLVEKSRNIRVIRNATSNQYVFRMNWLLPPFNNVKVRQAAAMALNQIDFLQANIGDSRFYRTCKAMFTCDTPLASDAGMEGLVEGNSVKAKEMLAASGYDGTPVTLLYPSDLGVIKQLGPVAKAALEKAGFKVDLQALDWQRCRALMEEALICIHKSCEGNQTSRCMWNRNPCSKCIHKPNQGCVTCNSMWCW